MEFAGFFSADAINAVVRQAALLKGPNGEDASGSSSDDDDDASAADSDGT